MDIEDKIRKRVSYVKLKSYLDQNEEVTIGELIRLHTFLDRHMLYGSRRIAQLYQESLEQLVKDYRAGIDIDVSSKSEELRVHTGRGTLSPDPYYALAHRYR